MPNVLREKRDDCLLASVARTTEARESICHAVFCFVTLPSDDEFSQSVKGAQAAPSSVYSHNRKDDDDLYSQVW